MPRAHIIRFNATVVRTVDSGKPGIQGVWEVEIANGHRMLAHLPDGLSEKGEKNTAIPQKEFLPGERLVVGCSPFDLSRGQIEFSSEKPQNGTNKGQEGV